LLVAGAARGAINNLNADVSSETSCLPKYCDRKHNIMQEDSASRDKRGNVDKSCGWRDQPPLNEAQMNDKFR